MASRSTGWSTSPRNSTTRRSGARCAPGVRAWSITPRSRPSSQTGDLMLYGARTVVLAYPEWIAPASPAFAALAFGWSVTCAIPHRPESRRTASG